MEIADINELQSFFYVATPQAILWSIAFTTFFTSGILLGRSGTSDISEVTYLSKTLKVDNDSNELETLTRREKQRNLVDERLLVIKEEVLNYLHDLIETNSLAIKLSVLEVLGRLKDYTSKPFLVRLLEESDYDLQYAAIRAIGYLDDVDVLFPLKNVVYAKDYITRRAAILSVIRISNSVKEDEYLEKLTAHIHIVIESYLELDQLGKIICKIIDYGDPQTFPEMKGYIESEIVKLEGLIEERDYSVEMYQNFARLIFPVYFPIVEDK